MEDVAPALQRAKAANGPAVVCLRTDHEANLLIPTELLLRFTKVYSGPIG